MYHHLVLMREAGILEIGSAGARCHLEELERRLWEGLRAIHPFGAESLVFLTENPEEVREWK